MKTITATEAKNKLGAVMDSALSEPVMIEKSGRSSVVIISATEYARLTSLEDAYWAARAAAATAGGFATPEEVAEMIKKASEWWNTQVRNLNPTKEALSFIQKLDPKQFKQVMNKILSLLADPHPADSKALKGYEDLLRVDIGEYRIIYRYNNTAAVSVLIVDKRNDDEVYKQLSRKNL